MKKFAMAAMVAVAAVAGLASCSGDKGCAKGACGVDDDQLYTGVMPAADCEGIRYTLKLDYDDNFTKGDYDLVETYLAADSTAVNGVRDNVSYKSEGDFTVINKDGKKILKLVKDVKDSNPKATATLNFEATSDSTLVMLNDSLQAPVSDVLNYTLKLVK